MYMKRFAGKRFPNTVLGSRVFFCHVVYGKNSGKRLALKEILFYGSLKFVKNMGADPTSGTLDRRKPGPPPPAATFWQKRDLFDLVSGK